jgi:hypothetical protein
MLELSALTLLVARVIADDHDPAVPTDDAALAADLLDARLDLHWVSSFRVTPALPSRRASHDDIVPKPLTNRLYAGKATPVGGYL